MCVWVCEINPFCQWSRWGSSLHLVFQFEHALLHLPHLAAHSPRSSILLFIASIQNKTSFPHFDLTVLCQKTLKRFATTCWTLLKNGNKRLLDELKSWCDFCLHCFTSSLSLCVMKLFIVHSYTDVLVRYAENRSIVNTMLTLWERDNGMWVITQGVTSSSARLWNNLYDYEGAWAGRFSVGR